jgi:hypothetical protein
LLQTIGRIFLIEQRNKKRDRRITKDAADASRTPDFWFYNAQRPSEKADLMCFSVISRKCLAGLLLTSAAVLAAGCSETASTPGNSPTGSQKSTPHAGSTTRPSKGREVPEAAPVSDDAASKPADEKSAGE